MMQSRDNIHSMSSCFELADSGDTDSSDDASEAMMRGEFADDGPCMRDHLSCCHNSHLIEAAAMLDDRDESHLRLVLVRHSSRTAAHRQRRELAAHCGYMEPSCTMRREIDSAVAQFRATAGLRMSSFRRSKNSSASVFQVAEESFIFFMNERGKKRQKSDCENIIKKLNINEMRKKLQKN